MSPQPGLIAQAFLELVCLRGQPVLREVLLLPTEQIRQRTFIGLLVVITLAFFWLLTPFVGAVFWAIVLAILFAPLQQRLMRWLPGRPNLDALISLLMAVIIVLVPVAWVAQSVVSELMELYQRVQTGRFNAGQRLETAFNALPEGVRPWLDRAGLDDIEAIKVYVSQFTTQAVRLLGNQALSIGQNTFVFGLNLAIMLYLLFFLLRDGGRLAQLIHRALPLTEHHKEQFLNKLAMVVRATIKGNVAVAIVQGVLGGLIFWAMGIPSPSLWGTVMAVLSLLPAVGASLVWGPVAIYFALTGDPWQAAILAAYGVLVIGLVDNVLRPILVGKDTRLPDYLVLVSTLGGLVLFGLSGFIAGPLIAVLFLVAWDLFITMQAEDPTLLAKPADTADAKGTADTADTADAHGTSVIVTAPLAPREPP